MGRQVPYKRVPQRRYLEYYTLKKNQLIGAARHASTLKDIYGDISSRIARKWRKEYQEYGLPSLRRIKRLGRPPKVLD